jgi:drug/metabolite transporter (DMT)-like permease
MIFLKLKTASPAAMMVMGCFFFVLTALFTKELSQQLPPLQVVFLRNVSGLLQLIPFLLTAATWQAIKRAPIQLQLSRNTFGLMAMITTTYALTLVPLAQFTAITFMAPLFTTAAAAVILKEVVHPRTWIAMAVSFGGIIVMVHDDLGTLGRGTMVAMLATLMIGIGTLMIKTLATHAAPRVNIFYMNAIMLVLSCAPALAVWQAVPAVLWIHILLLGTTNLAAHACLNMAFMNTPASTLMPLDFVRLPIAMVLGWLAFSEMPTWPMVFGALIIVVSTFAAVYGWRKTGKIA